MADVKWIKFYVSILTDKKIKRIRRMPAGDTIALIWAFLLAQAGESNKEGAILFNDEIPYSSEEFAQDYDFEIDTVRLAIATFEKLKMICVFDGIIYIKNWEKYQSVDSMEKIREQNRIRQEEFRKKRKLIQKDNVTSNVTVTESNAIEIELEEDKEKDINNNVQISKADIDTLFEMVWNLYPSKKGKGQVSDSKKRKLFQIGYEELSRAIERYKNYLNKNSSWLKPQNGSTFFNSGYVDYLDKNWKGEEDGGCTGTNDGNAKGEHENELLKLAREAGIDSEFEGFNL